MSKLAGSHYVLATLPIWAKTAIFGLILTTIFVGRDITEGLPYNVAYSSLVGDVGLMIVVLITATILQRKRGGYIPRWLQNKTVHGVIVFTGVCLGATVCMLTLGSRSGQVMDIYHDTVIVPLFIYLAITLVPIICCNGTKTEKRAAFCFVLLWLMLVGFDVKYDRMDQRSWLQNHGVTFKK